MNGLDVLNADTQDTHKQKDTIILEFNIWAKYTKIKWLKYVNVRTNVVCLMGPFSHSEMLFHLIQYLSDLLYLLTNYYYATLDGDADADDDAIWRYSKEGIKFIFPVTQTWEVVLYALCAL